MTMGCINDHMDCQGGVLDDTTIFTSAYKDSISLIMETLQEYETID